MAAETDSTSQVSIISSISSRPGDNKELNEARFDDCLGPIPQLIADSLTILSTNDVGWVGSFLR
jgi:hypothetical protein